LALETLFEGQLSFALNCDLGVSMLIAAKKIEDQVITLRLLQDFAKPVASTTLGKLRCIPSSIAERAFYFFGQIFF